MTVIGIHVEELDNIYVPGQWLNYSPLSDNTVILHKTPDGIGVASEKPGVRGGHGIPKLIWPHITDIFNVAASRHHDAAAPTSLERIATSIIYGCSCRRRTDVLGAGPKRNPRQGL